MTDSGNLSAATLKVAEQLELPAMFRQVQSHTDLNRSTKMSGGDDDD